MTTTTATVSQIELDRCNRIIDEKTGEAFYQVQSESDETKEYEVRYTAGQGFTCTCKAGQNGFAHCKSHTTCKHVRWACEHARLYREELEEQSAIERLVNQGYSRDTAIRVIYAQGSHPSEQAIKQAQYINQSNAFSLMR